MNIKNSLSDSVNLLQGTASTSDFSTGNTLPIVARPWGMHHWSLQTGKPPWIFNREHRKLQGIRLTHQPSPWMGDYGSLRILPFIGEAHDSPESQASAYCVDTTTLHPHYLRVELLRYRVGVEFSPTERGAVFVFDFKTAEAARIGFYFDGRHALRFSSKANTFNGATHDATGGVPENFGLHIYGKFDEPPTRFVPAVDGGHFEFAPGTRRITLRLAASFINQEIAEITWERELAGKSLETIAEHGKRIWSELLGRIRVEESNEKQVATFYSCLYRCLLFPRSLEEYDAQGNTIHYSPYDGQVHSGPLCTDSGFWDTYRTLYPLLAFIYPEKASWIMRGWMNACREANWAPKWPSPGPRDCMIGTHFDAVAADMVAKGITDWDIEGAYAFMWKNATVNSKDGRFGREGLEQYLSHGYVSEDICKHSVACTQDYAYGDFCTAQVALHLGRTSDYDSLMRRSRSYANLYDSTTGFFRPRLSNGQWKDDFNQYRWGDSYIEGGPWQYLFNVPHDVDGLARLMGGKSKVCERLDQMLAAPAYFDVGSYPQEIHEMTEMAMANFGQYAHSNQPVHNFLFLYALCGETEKCNYWVKRVATELYTPDHFPGDEDNGEMAAWYIWVSLGLFPSCPGINHYATFQPILKKAVLQIPGREEMDITTENRQSEDSLGKFRLKKS